MIRFCLFVHVPQGVLDVSCSVAQSAQFITLLQNRRRHESGVVRVILHSCPSSNQSPSSALVSSVALHVLALIVVLLGIGLHVYMILVPMVDVQLRAIYNNFAFQILIAVGLLQLQT